VCSDIVDGHSYRSGMCTVNSEFEKDFVFPVSVTLSCNFICLYLNVQRTA
jgi:hypothetical protein